MLIAALRSDNPLGGAPLTCDEAAEHFTLQGLGEISAAKLLDLENRRQLVWADPVTREWVIETAAIRVRKAAAAKAEARAAEAAAAAATAAATAASAAADSAAASDDRARAGGVATAGAGTLVFEPPRSTSSATEQPAATRRPAGIRAAQTRFEAPASAADGARRVVWSEPPGVAPPPLPAASAPSAVAPLPAAPDAAAMTTRRADRRSSVKAAERRHALVPSRLATAPAVAVLVLLAVVAVVVLLVVQHGGF